MEAKKIDKDLEWLRQVSKEVDLGTEDISEDLKVLEEYCLGHGVFAMAAVQLGIPKRLVYIKNTDLDKIEDEETYQSIRKQIGLLSERPRVIIYMYYYDGLAINEIARKLNISSGTVKWHLSDAKSNLKEEMVMVRKDNLSVNR